MEHKMDEHGSKNLGMVRGGLYAKRDPRPSVVRQCALELRERLVARLAGKRKSRTLGCVQSGVTNPTGEPMKIAGALQDARVGYDDSYRIVIAPQLRALARMHGKPFDEAA